MEPPSRGPPHPERFFWQRLPCQTHNRRGPDLRSGLPFGIRAPSTSHLPYFSQMGAQMCDHSRPRRPPPWEPGLGLSFSHLHVRLEGRGSLHPGVGPPLAIWNDFMARWPDPRERKNGPALHPP